MKSAQDVTKAWEWVSDCSRLEAVGEDKLNCLFATHWIEIDQKPL